MHQQLQCWVLFEWVMYIYHHSIVCCVCCRILCTIGRWSDQLQCMYINMQCWLLSEWIVHYNYHTLVCCMH